MKEGKQFRSLVRRAFRALRDAGAEVAAGQDAPGYEDLEARLSAKGARRQGLFCAVLACLGREAWPDTTEDLQRWKALSEPLAAALAAGGAEDEDEEMATFLAALLCGASHAADLAVRKEQE